MYEVIKAKTREEAAKKSAWTAGQPAICEGLQVSANSDGTYSVFPKFRRMTTGDGWQRAPKGCIADA